MSDMVCRKSMMRCQTPGMCLPHGGCRDEVTTAKDRQISALIAENERLTNRLEVDPRHDYDGISTRDATVKVLDEQVDQLKAENERLAKTADCWDRLNVQNKALSDSFRAERDQAEQDYKDVIGTIELRDIEISKLRAEVAGLRTGYEAYEQVNAELKAEVEELRKSLLDAAEEIDAWGSYASDYFQEKHDLAGCVAKFHAAAMGKGEQP